jgi:predicted phosphoribosyltransferase
MARFRDRRDAGRQLAARLGAYAGRSDVIVLALPRGGVPVAFEVASALRAPLDVFVVRKVGVPGHEELAVGAIASGGVRVLNDRVVSLLGLSAEQLERLIAEQARNLEAQEQMYRGDGPPPSVEGRHVLLVDDGLATGASMRAALVALRRRDPASLVVAVPLAARETCQELGAEGDEVVCVITPDPFHAVGLWYEDFAQTTDDEVRELLGR